MAITYNTNRRVSKEHVSCVKKLFIHSIGSVPECPCSPAKYIDPVSLH